MRVVNHPKNPRVFFAICVLAGALMFGAAASAWTWAQSASAVHVEGER